jgi:hypothetical protein
MARASHALLLATGELPRQPLGERVQLDHGEHVVDAALEVAAAHAAPMQPEGDVFQHRHVREQGVGLEHHADVAGVDGHVRHIALADAHAPAVRRHEARDDAQQRGLAGAGWAKQAGEAALAEARVDVVQHRRAGVAFPDSGHVNGAQACPLPCSATRSRE